MINPIKKFIYVRGQIFNNKDYRLTAIYNARKYCKENNIDESEIYELSSDSELAYLKELLARQEKGEIYELKSHERVALVGSFTNDNGDSYPPYEFETSFTYHIKGTNQAHVVYIPNSQYEITKELILSKTIYDYSRKGSGYYLEIYYLDDDDRFKEWKIGDKDIFIKNTIKKRKQKMAQIREIRKRERYDKLLKLRSEGKISEQQQKALYKLEAEYKTRG